VKVCTHAALLAYTVPALVVTGSTWREAKPTVAPEALHTSRRESSHTTPRTPAPAFTESVVKRSVSALAEDSTSAALVLPLSAASDRFDDEDPS
jgi:hypothetical protein